MNENLPSKNLFCNVSSLINSTKTNIVNTINSELVMLNYNIGKTIKIEILKENRAEYGDKVINELSKDLVSEYGRGYSKSNLLRMVQFYDIFNDERIVATVSRQLTWSHIREIIKLKDELKREFYIQMSVMEHWSVRTLRKRIDSALYERTILSKKPDETIKHDLELLKNEKIMSTDMFFRDPYVLDFLELKDTYSEKDLENAILSELERFILEFGSDFAFLSRQKRITIDDEDYYIDLLFYHRRLRRLVAIELKLNKFKPQHKSQMELYLRWLDKYEKNEGEESPLGIILCAEKSDETIELLELDKSGIHVGQYLTELPPKEVFEKKLIETIKKVKEKNLPKE